MVGIYKWTSPTGKIYIGQSKDLGKRYDWYLGTAIYKSKMTKLKRSFSKYGVKNHIYEIIEYCSLEQLNEREIYWGLHHDVLNKGLNCKLGEQNCIFSELTKKKMSDSKKGFKHTLESEQKRQSSLRKVWEEKNKIQVEKKLNKLKYIPTDEHKSNISKSKKGKLVHTDESKQKLKDHGKFRDLTKMWEASIKSTSKGIIQYDVNGNFIKEWPSANKAEYFYTGEKKDNIRQTIRHFEKTGIQWKAYGFVWKSK
jgi:group I intron endonuclease